MAAVILAIGTANPQNIVQQTDFADEYFRLTGCEHKVELKQKVQQMCEKMVIDKRHLGHIFEDIHKENSNVLGETYPSVESRFDLDYEEISKLGALASSKAIEEWGQQKSSITHLVVHSSMGIKMPGIDFQLVKLLGLQPSVKRFMLYHYGCMAGGTTLRLAKDIAENNAGARVLVVCAEVVLNFLHAPSDTNLIAPMLFGEGASAVNVGSNVNKLVERPVFQIMSADQTIIPQSEDLVGSKICSGGVVLSLARLETASPVIANTIESCLVEAFRPFGITDYNELFWIIHPGGTVLINALEEKLNLKKEKMQQTRHVLKEFGNMLSVTSYFVMNEMRTSSFAQGLATTGRGLDWGVYIGIGPGMTLEIIVLRSCPTS